MPEDITVGTVSVRRYRLGPLAEIATGHSGRDIVRRRLARFHTTSAAVPPDPHAEVVKALIEEGFDVGTAEEFAADETAPTKTDGEEKRVKPRAPSAPLLARPLLDHLKQAAWPLPVMDVAVVTLLAEALRAPGCSEEMLFTALKSSAPLICLRLPMRESEAVVKQLLQQGTILPHPIHLVDGLHYSFNDRWSPDDGAPLCSTVLSYPLTQLLAVSAERLRRTLAKATRAGAPILVLTETESLWPRRVVSSADIVLDAPRLDNRMLAEIIETCLGIPIESTLNGLATRTIKTGNLGLDDLALSIRPDRFFDDVLDRLEQLSRDNLMIDGDDETEEETSARTRKEAKDEPEEKTETTSRSTSSERSRGKGGKQHHVELILPQRVRKKRGSQPPLLLETLAGYGEARLWALELKADLKLWKRKKIRWSDMSTKLLLSGPPGTGKTTFAKALCNSLEIPLIATSVAEWLEPGYLGDVLRRMTAVFEAAQARQPVIMLIDEIDGIGRRDAGGGRNYDEYWVSLVNRLLELLDGALKSEGVIIIGATNRPDVIDPALRRSGRLETHINIEPPDLDALEGILAHHLGPDLRRVTANAAQAKALPADPQEPAHG
ncbi:AAA family ATPase [Pseudorhizobium flavum]|uniref:AAA family ATPase n=1 Tax=Pseudorhizobium flavum TaxID=1335061 RepID=UPI00160A033A|nr:ATP-binding protein [Pseudorhizobium flavum]